VYQGRKKIKKELVLTVIIFLLAELALTVLIFLAVLKILAEIVLTTNISC
jgi:hypothetical protein